MCASACMHVCVLCVCVFCPKLVWKLLYNLCWSHIHSNNPASASQVPELSTCVPMHSLIMWDQSKRLEMQRMRRGSGSCRGFPRVEAWL